MRQRGDSSPLAPLFSKLLIYQWESARSGTFGAAANCTRSLCTLSGIFPMSGSHQHRVRAEDCFRRSRQADDQESKAFFLSMAQLWLVLAHEHVRFERRAEDELNTGRVKM
jgi:hypothetical protein